MPPPRPAVTSSAIQKGISVSVLANMHLVACSCPLGIKLKQHFYFKEKQPSHLLLIVLIELRFITEKLKPLHLSYETMEKSC